MQNSYQFLCSGVVSAEDLDEVVYDYPTGVKSGEDEIEAVQVEMTPNSAYRTVTCSKEHASCKQSNI